MEEPRTTFLKALTSGTISILGMIGGNLEAIETALRLTSLCVGIVAGLITISLGIRAWRKK